MFETLKRIINKKKKQREEEEKREELARKAMPKVKERIVEFLKSNQGKRFTCIEVVKSLDLYYFNGESLAAIMVFQDFTWKYNSENIKRESWNTDWDELGDINDKFYYSITDSD